VVLKTRQHLAAVKPDQNALVLELMHFSEELVQPTSLQIPAKQEISSKELDMAMELIDRMSGKWQPEKYTDDYRHSLMELIEKKVQSGGRTPAAGPAPKQQPTKVIDLVSVLQQSLGQVQRGTAAQKPRAKKTKRLKKAA
jgi:DNA end-binding protein Ku